jgi:stress response protein YsnF
MSHSKSNQKQPRDPHSLECTPLEASAPLETSAPLESSDRVQRVVQQANIVPPVNSVADTSIPPLPISQEHDMNVSWDDSHSLAQPSEALQAIRNLQREPSASRREQPFSPPTIGEDLDIQLLEERLVVDRKKRKVGEVIVRKEIETHIVEVPVRREKLIIEEVGLETKQLASIDLGQPENDGREFSGNPNRADQQTISGEFSSIKAASQFLGTIAASQPDLSCEKVQIRILVETVEQAQVYQQWLDRYTLNSDQSSVTG